MSRLDPEERERIIREAEPRGCDHHEGGATLMSVLAKLEAVEACSYEISPDDVGDVVNDLRKVMGLP